MNRPRLTIDIAKKDECLDLLSVSPSPSGSLSREERIAIGLLTVRMAELARREPFVLVTPDGTPLLITVWEPPREES